MRVGLRSWSIALAFTAACAWAEPARAATIYQFSLSDGSATEIGSILSFSLDPSPLRPTFTFVKQIDRFSPVIFDALAFGTEFLGASFNAYDGTVGPTERLWEYAFTDVRFDALQRSGTETLEIVTLSSRDVVFTAGPAATPVPEPTSLSLLAIGLLVMMNSGLRVSIRKAFRHPCSEQR